MEIFRQIQRRDDNFTHLVAKVILKGLIQGPTGWTQEQPFSNAEKKTSTWAWNRHRELGLKRHYRRWFAVAALCQEENARRSLLGLSLLFVKKSCLLMFKA